MICVHDGKLHTLRIGRLQETLVERILEKRTPLVPVPVVHKNVNARRERGINLAGDSLWIVVLFVSPVRHERLIMSITLRTGLIHALPLAVPMCENLEFPPSRFTLIRWPDVGGNIVFGSEGIQSCADKNRQDGCGVGTRRPADFDFMFMTIH